MKITHKIKLLFILIFVLSSTTVKSQMQEGDFYFSIYEIKNFIIKDYKLYTMTGSFQIEDRPTNLNEYTFDLFYKGKMIGRYSDSDFNSFCELYTAHKNIKKDLKLYDLVSLKKIDEKSLEESIKIALLNYKNRFYTSPEILNNKGYFLYKYKYFPAALLYFNIVTKKFSSYVVAYLNIADCYWELKENDKAIQNYNKYIQLITEQKKDLKKIPK